MISIPHLQSIYGCKIFLAAKWVGPLSDAMHLAQVDEDHFRRAAFLAQVGHESGRLVWTRELWGPTKQQLRYDPKSSLAGRLGNVYEGDGEKYKGRGLIQVTGRANYAMTTVGLRKLLGQHVPDFEQEPHLLELESWAAMSAAYFWYAKGLNKWADSGDFAELTRRINGGYNGLADRQLLYARALMVH